MQTALRFLNRYAGLRAVQEIFKTKKTAEEAVEWSFFTVLVLANVFILLYPILYW
jgi:hypothetical protein